MLCVCADINTNVARDLLMVSDVTIAPTRGYGTRWLLKKIRTVSEISQEYVVEAICLLVALKSCLKIR